MQLINKLAARFARWLPICLAYKFVIKDWTRIKDLGALARVLESKRFSQNLEPVLVDYPKGKRILVLAPHPDDDILGAGGTLLRGIESGGLVKIICMTTGEREVAGSVVREREEEAQRVSEAMGSRVEFWRYPAHIWQINETIKNQLRAVIKEWQPDIVFLPFLTDDHTDHQRVSALFYATFKNNPPYCEVWAYQVYSTVLPNVIVDISGMLEKKLSLVGMFKSQMKHRDWAHYIKGLNAFNSRFLKTNTARYAEMFFVVPADEYINLCKQYYEY